MRSSELQELSAPMNGMTLVLLRTGFHQSATLFALRVRHFLLSTFASGACRSVTPSSKHTVTPKNMRMHNAKSAGSWILSRFLPRSQKQRAQVPGSCPGSCVAHKHTTAEKQLLHAHAIATGETNSRPLPSMLTTDSGVTLWFLHSKNCTIMQRLQSVTQLPHASTEKTNMT